MKTRQFFFLFVPVILLISCGPLPKVYKLKPYEPVHSYWENGIETAFQETDSVFVSVRFDQYRNGEYILDLAIDNQSDTVINFDPIQIYMILYSSDSILAQQIRYHQIEPQHYIDSINKKIKQQERRVNRNIAFSILMGVAHAAAEVSTLGDEEVSHEEKTELRASSMDAQLAMAEGRHDAWSEIDYLEYQKQYWKCDVWQKTSIEPNEIKYGKIHFRFPYAPQTRMYIPVGNRIFRFAFINDVY